MFKQENPWWGVHLFFMLYTLGQSFLEVCVFVLIAYLLKQWTYSWVFYTFIGLSFMALLAHYVDFTLLRLMDTSFSYIFQFFIGSGINHLYTAFLALNMNMTMVGCIIISVLTIPFVGVGFYLLTRIWTQKRPWSLSIQKLCKTLLIVSISLFFLDLFAYPWLNRKAYSKYEKALPLGKTFLSPPPTYQQLERPLAPVREEEQITKRLETVTALEKTLPNIYFFIIETLRSDFICEEIAPVLSQFVKDNITLTNTFANANYTNLSWFALLHATLPHQWTHIRDHYQEGSAPLRILKQLGYQIRIYSSADLSYFNMQTTLFGKQDQLIDHLQQYTDQRSLEPYQRDALAIESFERDLDQNQQGTVFLFFLDSTHSEYSFPKDEPLTFQPIAEQISYLTISKSHKDLELLKNRYRNSIHYVDSLLGKFLSLLRQKNLYEDSMIVFTGDHAEEFFEEGSLFHGTHLNRYQTAVPIACKLQDNSWKERIDPKRNTLSHIDIFPSMIHYLTGSSSMLDLFDGQSIFVDEPRNYHLSFLQNGASPPVEFSLEWENQTIKARIVNPNCLEILESSNPSPSFINEHIFKTFGRRAREDL